MMFFRPTCKAKIMYRGFSKWVAILMAHECLVVRCSSGNSYRSHERKTILRYRPLFRARSIDSLFISFNSGWHPFGHVNIDHSPDWSCCNWPRCDWPRWYWPRFDWPSFRLTTVPIDHDNFDHGPDWPPSRLATVPITSTPSAIII